MHTFQLRMQRFEMISFSDEKHATLSQASWWWADCIKGYDSHLAIISEWIFWLKNTSRIIYSVIWSNFFYWKLVMETEIWNENLSTRFNSLRFFFSSVHQYVLYVQTSKWPLDSHIFVSMVIMTNRIFHQNLSFRFRIRI